MRNENTKHALEIVYQKKRDETITKIRTAINEIREIGGKVTISEICKVTGLSNAVFYKPHVKELLAQEPEWQKVTRPKQQTDYFRILESDLESVNKQVSLFKSRNQDLQIALERKTISISKLESLIKEKDEELELLRGKYHALLTIVEQINGFENVEISLI